MTESTTRIRAQAVLVGVKATLPKPDQYGSATKPGALEVTFRIEQPAPPKKPAIASWSPLADERPEDLEERPEDFDPAEWKKTIAEVQREQREWDKLRAKHDEELAAWAVAQEAFQPSLMAFAQLSGLAMVLGNQRINLEMSPADTDFLPGFELALLAPGGAE